MCRHSFFILAGLLLVCTLLDLLCLKCFHELFVECFVTLLVLLVVLLGSCKTRSLLCGNQFLLFCALLMGTLSKQLLLQDTWVQTCHDHFVLECILFATECLRCLKLWPEDRLHFITVDDAGYIGVLHCSTRQA